MQAGKIYLQNNGNTFYLGGTIVYRSSNWPISVVLLFHFKDGKFPYLCLVVHFDKLCIIVHLCFVMKNDRGCYLFVNFCCCCCYFLIICIYFSNFSFFSSHFNINFLHKFVEFPFLPTVKNCKFFEFKLTCAKYSFPTSCRFSFF